MCMDVGVCVCMCTCVCVCVHVHVCMCIVLLEQLLNLQYQNAKTKNGMRVTRVELPSGSASGEMALHIPVSLQASGRYTTTVLVVAEEFIVVVVVVVVDVIGALVVVGVMHVVEIAGVVVVRNFVV